MINVGVAHTLLSQIDIKASASSNLVKDESIIIDEAGSADNDSILESAIPTNTNQPPSITIYTVKSGDTLSGIAESFDISVNTIRWANDMTPKTVLKAGDELVILPVTGIEYTVKKGDTLSGIAVKFDASQEDILYYNDIEASSIKIGMKLIVPEAEPLPVAPKKVATPKTIAKASATIQVKDEVSITNKTEIKSDSNVRFINPVPGAVLTQRIHDGNAVDFGLPVGSRVLAAGDGKVIISRAGYNGGYGTYIVITHDDGSQTLYAHLSKLNVAVGDRVTQGQTIGLSGNTGRSTGPHLHYKEIGTGAKNTFAKLPLH